MLREPEVEQLHHAVAVHEDVRRLEVAVDDEIAMRILRRLAHRQEQPHTLLDAERSRSSRWTSIGLPSTYSSTKYGVPSSVAPAVEQPRDVGVIQRGEDLPLGAKARS